MSSDIEAASPPQLPPGQPLQPPASPRAAGRARCPACGAPRQVAERQRQTVCHRCRSDLSLLLAMEARSDRKLHAALGAYKKGCFREAAARAAEACRLEARPLSFRLLAVSALRSGDFITAVRAARQAAAMGEDPGAPPNW
ncbi:MAG TPA: hypothetical protein VMT52_01445 [Planctomycetota bacterium]|nr:hypothetical protein [Planctomycetota bacterium]